MDPFYYSVLLAVDRICTIMMKELIESIRRPGAVFSLGVAPFLLMAMFGIGYSGGYRPLETVVVVPPSSVLPRNVSFYQSFSSDAVRIVEVVSDAEEAEDRLLSHDIDLVILTPDRILERLLEGERAPVTVQYIEVDPIREGYMNYIVDRQVRDLNRTIWTATIGAIQTYIPETPTLERLEAIPPAVLASPLSSVTENVLPFSASVVNYFAPTLLALIIQHLAISMTALSLARERFRSTIVMFRVSGIPAWQILVGKYLAFGLFSMTLGAAVVAFTTLVFGVPQRGSPVSLMVVVGLLTLVSLGIGLLIASVADSEPQAVQLSMLVLLASVFFGGIVLPLEQFIAPVQIAAQFLPVTHAIRLLQQTMLLGEVTELSRVGSLSVMALVVFVLASLALHRSLRRDNLRV